jgi:integrase
MGKRSNGYRKEVRGDGALWIIDFSYRDTNGRMRRYRRDASVQSAAGACGEAKRLMQLAVETGSLETKPPSMTFAEFIETRFRPIHMVTLCRPATRVRYEALLRQGVLEEFGKRRLADEWAMPMRKYAATLIARGIKTRPHLSFVRTILRSAVDLGELARMPDVPPLEKRGKKLPDAPSDEDLVALLGNAEGWVRVAIALAAFAGLRSGEVRALEVQDIDLARGRMIIRHAISGDEVLTPKSGHERVVPIAPELKVILTEAMRLKLPHARVVLNTRGESPERTAILTALNALENRIGLRRWSFHSLRHYFCSTLIRRGGSLEAVRVLAGHSNLSVTQRYVHATGADLEAAIARLGNGLETGEVRVAK